LIRPEADRHDHAPRRMIRRSGVIAILNQSSGAGRPWRVGDFVASAGTGGLVPLADWRGRAGVEVVSGMAFPFAGWDVGNAPSWAIAG
jgi:F420-0:gamma-glutamyl ligase